VVPEPRKSAGLASGGHEPDFRGFRTAQSSSLGQPFGQVGRYSGVTPPADFVERFRELFGVAYRSAFAILGNREDAEDCAQDALARLLDRWQRIGPDAAVPWVARVSQNAAIDRWRKQQRALNRLPARSPDSTARVQRTDLVRALRELPPRQREAVVLRHVCDLSEQQAASAMDCSIGTVKSATARGLERLRARLGPAWAWED
jgi:RNA polymerase sigma-70 factor (sigma-E family)